MTGDAILTGLHILFATIWVGPQLLVAVAVVPALRGIDDERARLEAIQRFARRFNLVAWPAMLGLVITGGIKLADRLDEVRDAARALGGDTIYDVRWGYIFDVKIGMVIVAVALVALHSFVIGPRLVALQRRTLERAEAGAPAEVQALRKWSMALAGGGLLLSILVVIAAGFLAEDFALQGI